MHTDPLLDRLFQADAETLLRWSERLLTAHRPEGVFGDRH